MTVDDLTPQVEGAHGALHEEARVHGAHGCELPAAIIHKRDPRLPAAREALLAQPSDELASDEHVALFARAAFGGLDPLVPRLAHVPVHD